MTNWISKFVSRQTEGAFDADWLDHVELELPQEKPLAVAQVQGAISESLRSLNIERSLLEGEIALRQEKLRQVNVALLALIPANNLLVDDMSKERKPLLKIAEIPE